MSESISSGEQPEYFEIKLDVSRTVNDRIANMATRRDIDTTELLRRALGVFDAFDRLLLLHPEGHAEWVMPKPESEAGIVVDRLELDIPIK
jgi:hypothetical protein